MFDTLKNEAAESLKMRGPRRILALSTPLAMALDTTDRKGSLYSMEKNTTIFIRLHGVILWQILILKPCSYEI